MKKIFIACAMATACCVASLNAQERFFLYGKILGADGTPVPSAEASVSTVIGRQPVSVTQAGPDGSFKLVVSGQELTMLKFTAPFHDSLTIPLLLTTVQHTMSLTVRLSPRSMGDPNAAQATSYAPVRIKDENTELGIAERLMAAFIEEKHLDSAGDIVTPDHPRQHRDPDSLLASLSARARAEVNPMHRELFLLRYMQACTNAKRGGDPAVLKMVFHLVEPDSPFWSLAPELLKSPAHTGNELADYTRRVKLQTPDPELKAWIESRH